MVDIRKIIIIFVIAILFSVLVFSVIEAVYPNPKYEDFCKDRNYLIEKPVVTQMVCPEINVSSAERQQCDDKKGYIEFTEYDSNNCPHNYECNTCQNDYDNSQDQHNRYVFYISAIFALLAIFLGMYLPAKQNTLNEWMGTGFMLGGAFALFFGTASSFGSLDRYTRPIIIFLELALVIFIAYKKIGNLRQDKKKKK